MRVPHTSRCGEGWVCSSEQPHRDFVAFAVVAPAAKSTHWHPGAQRGICILFCRSAESHSPRRSLPAARRESSRGRRLCSAEYRAFCGTLRLLTPVFAVAFVAPAFRPAAFRFGLAEVLAVLDAAVRRRFAWHRLSACVPSPLSFHTPVA